MPWYPQTPHALFPHNGIPRYESLTYFWSTVSNSGSFPSLPPTEHRMQNCSCRSVNYLQSPGHKQTAQWLWKDLLCRVVIPFIYVYTVHPSGLHNFIKSQPVHWSDSEVIRSQKKNLQICTFDLQKNFPNQLDSDHSQNTRFYCVLQLSLKGPFVHCKSCLHYFWFFTSQHQPLLLKRAEISPEVYLHS